jgi:hypothetical protein
MFQWLVALPRGWRSQLFAALVTAPTIYVAWRWLPALLQLLEIGFPDLR